jgi:hypothetical protein
MSTLEISVGAAVCMQQTRVSNRERRNAQNDCEGQAALLQTLESQSRDGQIWMRS